MATGSESSVPEEERRLRVLLFQLQAEAGVLDRVAYKNKNQHRRGSYFQFLLKVRRDLRLLLSARLPEILNAVLPIVHGTRPAERALHRMRSKKQYPTIKHTYKERLLGIARLLSQMPEPIIKAAIQISLLLAKSFFAGFSTMVLALLARIRVLVQQILIDVVSVFNKISALSQAKHSVKLTQEGIEAFREFYPTRDNNIVLLECRWEDDKFVLLERTQDSCRNEDKDQNAIPPTPSASIQYETIQFFSDDQCMESRLGSENNIPFENDSITGTSSKTNADIENKTRSEKERTPNGPSEDVLPMKVDSSTPSEDVVIMKVDSFLTTDPPAPQPRPTKKVAFVSVRSTPSPAAPNKKLKLDPISSNAAESEDPLSNLLAFGSSDSSIF